MRQRNGLHGFDQQAIMVLYLFNPLVLYNGAFYGRFDAIALAFVLLAIELYHTRWFSLAFGLAIAAKTFPVFLHPAVRVRP